MSDVIRTEGRSRDRAATRCRNPAVARRTLTAIRSADDDTFILAPERDGDPQGAFSRYDDYIRRESSRFPPGALALATSDWYFGFDDHRAPHDAWLISAVFAEANGSAHRHERALALRLRLLSAYRDHEIELYYPSVIGYTFQGTSVATGHGDWRYDEFRIDDGGLAAAP